MNKLLIVNADDFGLSKAQNYGVVEAFRHGIVTSTTTMVNSPAAEHAAELSKMAPELAIGLHFVLTLGKPLSAVPSLVNDKGELGKWIWQMSEDHCLDLQQIEQELQCQFAHFIYLFGRKPTHIDSHHHIHMLPQIYPLVEAFAKSQGVGLRIDRQQLKQHGLFADYALSTDWFTSDFYGEAISEALFLSALDTAGKNSRGSVEMMCHPSFLDHTILASKYCYPRLTELDVLTSPTLKAEIEARGYRLGSFRDLYE